MISLNYFIIKLSRSDILIVDLDQVEKALRNIINGKNAFDYLVGSIQARMVKVLMEEGIEPTYLLQKGLIHGATGEVRLPKELQNLLHGD